MCETVRGACRKCKRKLKDNIHPAGKKRADTGGAVCQGRDAPLDKFTAHDDHDRSILAQVFTDLAEQAEMPVVKRIIFGYDSGDAHIASPDKVVQ